MLNRASHFRQQCEFDKALDYSISSFAVGASEFHYFQEKGYNKILWKEFADVPIIKNKGLFVGDAFFVFVKPGSLTFANFFLVQ